MHLGPPGQDYSPSCFEGLPEGAFDLPIRSCSSGTWRLLLGVSQWRCLLWLTSQKLLLVLLAWGNLCRSEKVESLAATSCLRLETFKALNGNPGCRTAFRRMILHAVNQTQSLQTDCKFIHYGETLCLQGRGLSPIPKVSSAWVQHPT